jgi:hypothetical protein
LIHGWSLVKPAYQSLTVELLSLSPEEIRELFNKKKVISANNDKAWCHKKRPASCLWPRTPTLRERRRVELAGACGANGGLSTDIHLDRVAADGPRNTKPNTR